MLQVKDKIYWAGVKDWELKTFHGHELSTHRGSTYNSYLIRDEKTVLVDTVWEPFREEFVAALEREVELDRIDYIIVNHSEIDHSGSLPYLMEKIPHTPIYCTKNGAEILKKHYHKDWDFHIVKTGDVLSTGEYELIFVEAPMLHWPDSMMTYVKGANVLLSNDAFGQHYATSTLFNDDAEECEIYQEAIKYYANILTPFSQLVKKKIEQLQGLNLPIDIIAPSHGVIWRKNPLRIVEKYYEWCQDYQEDTVAIVYDTMWNGTRNMAHAIAEGVAFNKMKYKIIHSAVTDKNDLLTEIFKAKAIIVGSPTVNNTVLSPIAAFLEEVKGLRFKNKAAAAFGSYGWSGESPKIIHQKLQDAGFRIVQEPIQFKYQPTPEELAQCREFGDKFVKGL